MAATKKPAARARAGTKAADASDKNAAKKPAVTSKPARTGSSSAAKKPTTTPAKKRTTTSTSKRSTTKSTPKSPQAATTRRKAPEPPQGADTGSKAVREAHTPVEQRVGRTPTGQVVPITKKKTFQLPEDVVAILRNAVVEAAIRGDRLTESQSVTTAVRAWGKKHGYDKPHQDLQ